MKFEEVFGKKTRKLDIRELSNNDIIVAYSGNNKEYNKLLEHGFQVFTAMNKEAIIKKMLDLAKTAGMSVSIRTKNLNRVKLFIKKEVWESLKDMEI